MAQRAIDWEVQPEGDTLRDPDLQPPIVFPIQRRRLTRHVGVVKQYAPAKSYGLVGSDCGDALFSIDDVAVCDRAKLDNGQTVTFEVFDGPDGQTARHVRIDGTTLPPRPDASSVSRGWR
jgi:cold shock CspA family protein